MTGRLRLGSRLHRDEEGFVLSFFIKIALVMVLVGLAVEEGGQVAVAQIHSQSAAREAAQAASDLWAITHDMVRVRQAAQEGATKNHEGARVEFVSINSDGIATVRVREVAHTLVIQHVGFLASFRVQRTTTTQGRSL